MAVAEMTIKLWHPKWGLCDLVRIEGTDWIVRFESNGNLYHISPGMRAQFQRIQPPSLPEVNQPVSPPSQPASTSAPPDRRRLLRVIESLRNGLPPVDADARRLAVGIDGMSTVIRNLLYDVNEEGGRAMVVRGEYGQGKTFILQVMEEMALESGYMVARTEIDATENRLDKPHHIYRDLLKNLRVPGASGRGTRELTVRAGELVRQNSNGAAHPSQQVWAGYHWLQKELDCEPLAWLLSDTRIPEHPTLLGLLSCDPSVRAADARAAHRIPGTARTWPVFNVGTQGDFGSYLLSGLGRLARLLDYKGFVIILDEMEKWQDLDWRTQCRAGNLLGGLIWGATAAEGRRGKHDNPRNLTHSGRCAGYPFTTVRRCFLGVALAMTPRGDLGPERTWSEYGLLEIVDLPRLTPQLLEDYCNRIAPLYAGAYELGGPTTEALLAIYKKALASWSRRGDFSTRTGVQSAIGALDSWRDQLQ